MKFAIKVLAMRIQIYDLENRMKSDDLELLSYSSVVFEFKFCKL